MFRIVLGAFTLLPVLAMASAMFSAEKPSGCCGVSAVAASGDCPCGQCEEGCGCCVGGSCTCEACDCEACDSAACAAGCTESGSCDKGCCPASESASETEENAAIDGEQLTSASCTCGMCEEGCGCCIGAECTCADCECALCVI
jgi:hypothetical protein